MSGTTLPLKVRFLSPVLRRLRPAWLASWVKRLAGIQRVVIRVESDLAFLVDPVSQFGNLLIRCGAYEPALASVLKRFLHPGNTFVDIGANEGYFTVLGSLLVGPTGRVLAVEPQSRLRLILQENCKLNGLSNVKLIRAAISDVAGTSEFHLSPDMNTGSSGLSRGTRYRVATERVCVTTLSQLLAQERVEHVDLLKMDIEGYEYEAILGSEELFSRGVVRALAVELHPWAMESRARDPNRIAQMLFASGYRQVVVDGYPVFLRESAKPDSL